MGPAGLFYQVKGVDGMVWDQQDRTMYWFMLAAILSTVILRMGLILKGSGLYCGNNNNNNKGSLLTSEYVYVFADCNFWVL